MSRLPRFPQFLAVAAVSFPGHREIYRCNGEQPEKPLPVIASMSLQLAIPGWVALQQSPLALRQLTRSWHGRDLMKEKTEHIIPGYSQSKNCKGCPETKCKGCSETRHGFRVLGRSSAPE